MPPTTMYVCISSACFEERSKLSEQMLAGTADEASSGKQVGLDYVNAARRKWDDGGKGWKNGRGRGSSL